MLIDELLPDYDVCDRYSEIINASPEVVWDSLWTVNLCDSAVVSTLFMLRGLRSDNLSLSDLDEMKFRLIGEERYVEVVFGLIGQFWTPAGNLQDFEPGDFVAFEQKGFAKCAWSFQLETHNGKTKLVTETRVMCTDPTSRGYFDWYWAFVRPFSGWTRKEILATVKRDAEKG
jgi:hypothetical protein